MSQSFANSVLYSTHGLGSTTLWWIGIGATVLLIAAAVTYCYFGSYGIIFHTMGLVGVLAILQNWWSSESWYYYGTFATLFACFAVMFAVAVAMLPYHIREIVHDVQESMDHHT